MHGRDRCRAVLGAHRAQLSRGQGLPSDALLLALVGFNLGVELGQLAIVGAFLPVAYWLRRTTLYRRVILLGGSALICVVAGVWFAERAFNLKLMPL